MPVPYEFLIPVQTKDVEYPNFEVRGLELRETHQSQQDDRELNDEEYEIVASFTANSGEQGDKKTEVYKSAQRLCQIISLVTEHNIELGSPGITYRTDQSVRLTGVSGAGELPEDLVPYLTDVFENLERTLESTDDIEDDTLRSLRWFTTGLTARDENDQFLAFWLALEIFAKKQERDESNIEQRACEAMEVIRSNVSSQELIDEIEGFMDRKIVQDVEINDDAAEQAMDAVRRNISDDYIKSRVNGFISKEIKQEGADNESIAEAIDREIREILGSEHQKVYDGLLNEVNTWENDRNALVHAGVPIEDAGEKVPRMKRYLSEILRHKLDPIFTGQYTSSLYPDLDTVLENVALRTLLRENGEPMTRDEIKKEVFAGSRNLQTVRKVEALLDETLRDLDSLGIQETTEDGETAYEFVGRDITLLCPVCDAGFDSRHQLARHLGETDLREIDGVTNYHAGNHGQWRESNDFPQERRALPAIEHWVIDHENAVQTND